MGWIYFETAKEVVEWLKKEMEEEYREFWLKRYQELAEKVIEFDKEYFSSGEDISLGYVVIIKPYNIFVEAITAYGEEEPKVVTVDIEEWLRSRDDP
jgi:hypothetical protein